MKHKVVFGPQLRSQAGLCRKQGFGGRTIRTSASSRETVDRGQFVMRPVSKQPRSNIDVSMEFSQGVRCGAIAAWAQHVGSIPDQPFDHG
jgi:hypothetical protein